MRSLTFKQFMESSLEELPFLLAFMKELGATKAQAKEVMRLFRDEVDWAVMDRDTMELFFNKWDPVLLKGTPDWHPGMAYSDFAVDELSKDIRKKYKLDTREIIGIP